MWKGERQAGLVYVECAMIKFDELQDVLKKANWVAKKNNVKISDTNKSILVHMIDYALENGSGIPLELNLSVDKMSENFGISKRTVELGVKRLTEAGLIKRIPIEERNGKKGFMPMKTIISTEVYS